MFLCIFHCFCGFYIISLIFISLGAILDTDEAVSAFRLAIDIINEKNLAGQDITLTYVVNTTQIIATFESIQLGNVISHQHNIIGGLFDWFGWLVACLLACLLACLID